jgi:hypothetical protein
VGKKYLILAEKGAIITDPMSCRYAVEETAPSVRLPSIIQEKTIRVKRGD